MKSSVLNRFVDEGVMFIYLALVTYPLMLFVGILPGGARKYVRSYFGLEEQGARIEKFAVLSPIWFFLISSTFVRLYLKKWAYPACKIVWERASDWSEVEWAVNLGELLLIVALNSLLVWVFELLVREDGPDLQCFRYHFLLQSYLWGIFYILYRLGLSINARVGFFESVSWVTYIFLGFLLFLQVANYLPDIRMRTLKIPQWAATLVVLGLCGAAILLQYSMHLVNTNKIVDLLLVGCQ